MVDLVVLGGVALNNSIQWVDRHKQAQVGQTVKRLLGASPVVRTTQLHGLMDITLEATEDQGWLTLAVVKQLKAMAAVPGAAYSLNINSEVYSVIFRHHDHPALDLRPLISRIPEVDTEYYIGTIKLTTI